MSRLKDITGQTFGDWFVIERTGKDSRGNAVWLCRCACGDEHVVRGDDLRNGGSHRCTKCAFGKTNHFVNREKNRFEVFGDSIAIWLDYPSKVCFVDAIDFPLVKEHVWSVSKGRPREPEYAVSGNLQMHCVIKGTPPEGKIIDHWDRDGLNNRRSNLRFATHTENMRNRAANYNKVQSQHKGVRKYSGKEKPFEARIQVNKKRIVLGRFETEEEAAEAYNKAAEKYFGEFASLNELKKNDLIFNQ